MILIKVYLSISTFPPFLESTRFFGSSYSGYNTLNYLNGVNLGWMIRRIKYVLTNITITYVVRRQSFYMTSFMASNSIFSTSNIVLINENTLAGGHFYGISAIQNARGMFNTLHIVLNPYTSLNVVPYALSVLNLYRQCPPLQPYFYVVDGTCYSSCPGSSF